MKTIFNVVLPFFLFFIQLSTGCNTTDPVVKKEITSNNFSFESFSFGEHSSSVINDVAIINDSSIWAVGEIFLNDSLGQPDPLPYNAAYWNGYKWEIKRITVKFRGSPVTLPLRSILTFGEKHIWVCSGIPIKGDGQSWVLYHLYDMGIFNQTDGSLIKIWGNSDSDLYFVGYSGSVCHFDGKQWLKIESKTNLDIYDIWGDGNLNGATEIIAVAAKQSENYNKKIFKIFNNTVQDIKTDSIPQSIHGIWFKSGQKYLISGSGLYAKNNITSNELWQWLHPEVTEYYLYAIRGIDTNDIFACGAFGELLHYNGESWKSFRETTSLSNGEYYNIAIKENLIVTVGYNGSKAVITMGRRK